MLISECILFILSCFIPSIRRDLELQSNIEKQNDFLENEEVTVSGDEEKLEIISMISNVFNVEFLLQFINANFKTTRRIFISAPSAISHSIIVTPYATSTYASARMLQHERT